MTFPSTRPVGYDPDKVFDESVNDWTATLSDLNTTGGEKYRTQLVVISDQGNLYYGSL